MERLRRWLKYGVVTLSVMLLVGSLLVWVQNYWSSKDIYFMPNDRTTIEFSRGRINLIVWSVNSFAYVPDSEHIDDYRKRNGPLHDWSAAGFEYFDFNNNWMGSVSFILVPLWSVDVVAGLVLLAILVWTMYCRRKAARRSVAYAAAMITPANPDKNVDAKQVS